MTYQHRQYGQWHLVIMGFGLVYFVAVALLTRSWPVVAVSAGVLGLLTLLAMSGRFLAIRDAGDHLEIAFGPVPLFHKRVAYADIVSVEPGESRWIDGWGIHYTPFRGWFWNIWGYSCVVLHLRNKKRPLHLGTDDVHGLIQFLESRITSPQGR